MPQPALAPADPALARWPMTPGLPLTKFKVPRPRRDFVPRDSLRDRLDRCTRDFPVTLVAAPAGSGKTTLLVQLAERAMTAGMACVWVGLDEHDNDPARLLATLVQSLQSLSLHWDTDPRALVANVTGSGSEARAVLAGIVNALFTASAPRLLWVLDDLHRLDDPATASVLEALIERLPPSVSLLLGSRTEPALPLARLRAHGELGELGADDLRFDEATVIALAQQRWGAVPPRERVQRTLERTQGWAVGVNLLLAAGPGLADAAGEPRAVSAGEGPGPAARGAPQRVMFDFLAQEVLDELPPELRRFAIDCAVLADLAPARCEAVSGRADARVLLDALLRRHLFVTVVDEQEPVLRFHDLLREFLLTRLANEPAAHRTALQARAAAAETQPERAIGHWLRAQRWDEAADLIARHGLRLAADGAYASIERWIEALPAEVVEREPRLALLRAECAWSRWDWERVLQYAGPAAEGLAAAGDQAGWLRAQLLNAATIGAVGRLQERAEMTEATLALPDLPDGDAAQFHLQRAWSDFALGRSGEVAHHLQTMNDIIARDPAAHAPLVAQTFNCHYGGLPGVTEATLRYVELCDRVPRPAAMPWHSSPVVHGAWAALWQGRRAGAEQGFGEAEQIQHTFGKVRYVLLDATHLQALLLAATGQIAAGRALLDGLLTALESSDAGGLRLTWQRPYRAVRARLAWMAQDAAWLAAEAAGVAGPPREREWPLAAAAVETVQGQAALLQGDLDGAARCLASAAERQARYPAPAFYADPRLALALLHLQRGDRAEAWRCVQPMLAEVARDGTPGRLLLEPPARVRELLALCPPGAPVAPTLAAALRLLDDWARTAPGGPADAPERSLNPVERLLTEREREVLDLVAQGLPNKVLARRLALSAHTVKRHLANILDKLDCDNRGQAADRWRRGA
jgi:LuxR family maltose regulon positive regulatory protein